MLELRDGLPKIVDTAAGLAVVCSAIAGGTGPVAIDAERASGYRYSARAYLLQLRREGAGTFLVDPIAFDSLDPLQEALEGTEWLLHAATQDLPCLTELGLYPTRLFDTELAGRLLGYPRVGLASLVESLLGRRMAKEHSAVDWSTRPLPEPWLEYAALDVEVLVELREVLGAELVETGKDGWAAEEFEWLKGFTQHTRVDQWRRTSGLHKVRGRRALGAVRALWTTRDQIAAERDVTPSRIIPDSAIVAAALAMPTTRTALKATKGFYGRGADRYAGRWVAVLTTGTRPPGGAAADPNPARRRAATTAGLGRQGPGRGPTTAARARGHHRDRRGAPAPGREPADPRLRPPGAVDAAGDPRPRTPHPGGLGRPARPGRPGLAGTPHRADRRGGRVAADAEAGARGSGSPSGPASPSEGSASPSPD